MTDFSPEVIAAIHELTADPVNRKRDPLDWARRIIQRDANGYHVNLFALQSAKEALKL